MSRFTPATRAWFIATAIASLLVTIATASLAPVTPIMWGCLALLSLCAMIAHRYPIRSATAASYRLTNVFLTAGALLLPPALLTPLVLLAITPDAIIGKKRSGIAVRLVANVPPTILATQAAGGWYLWMGGGRIETPIDLLAALAAAGILTLAQNAIVGLGMSLNFHLPLHRVDTLSPHALLSDGLFALLGIAIAGLWLAEPILLMIVLPALITAHKLTRTAHLANLAQVDSKTGLHNARHFEEALNEEVAHSLRVGRAVSVLFADLDFFKRVNDQHGHAAGDQVLLEFAGLMAENLRKNDIIARFGGEEFVAILPGTDGDEAFFLAERLRAVTEEHAFALPGGTRLRCTVSLGIASCPRDASTVQELLDGADQAMYRAKQTRNAVARSADLPSVPRLVAAPPAAVQPTPHPTASTSQPLIVWGTVAVGAIALAVSVTLSLWQGSWSLLLPLMVFAITAELLTIQVFEHQRNRITISFSIATIVAAIVLLPTSAPLIAAIGAIVHIVKLRQWRRGADRVLFNLANPAFAAGIATLVATPLAMPTSELNWRFFGLVSLATLTYYSLNHGIVALTIAAHTGRSPVLILKEALWSSPSYLLLGVIGGFLGTVYTTLGPGGVAMFTAPILMMRITLAWSSRKNRQALEMLEIAKKEVDLAHDEKEQTLRQLISTIALIIDARDQAVAGHSSRVAKYAVAIGMELGLSARDLAYVQTAGLLHDLGKVAIPETILHKPGRLTEEEFAIVKEHAATGERILVEVKPLLEVARMVGDHHERFDGAGYPAGESGTAISQGGRILAVADTLDSILSDRPYSPGKPLSWALDELVRCAGTHFDPTVVQALQRVADAHGPTFFAEETPEANGQSRSDLLASLPILRHPAEAKVAALAAAS